MTHIERREMYVSAVLVRASDHRFSVHEHRLPAMT